MDSKKELVLSIKPEFSHRILEGTKQVELRRRFPLLEAPKPAWIYSSSPEKSLIGKMTVEAVRKMPVETIWNAYSDVAGIDEESYQNYFHGVLNGFVLALKDIQQLETPIPLDILRKHEFRPPQSFCYLKPETREFIDNQGI